MSTLTKTNDNKIPRTNSTGSTVRSEIWRPEETLLAGHPPATAVISLPNPLPPLVVGTGKIGEGFKAT
ncbi:hypothetical protein A2U01_0028097 [Trifolium medium]|uniref:Uncharacterized protein n=1 Tax=Trifolium medium TaxID=97028 RepID=A0A392P5L8_9FABA|nr:hypothetical protein [Trifolium medium]